MKYIFFTTSINSPGGIQCYLAAKARYLESQKWDVHVVCAVTNKRKRTPIPYLNKFLKEESLIVSLPPFMYPSFLVKKAIGKIQNKIGDIDPQEECIVESHDDVTSQWGELFASKIKARHYIYMMNEYYRGPNKYYECKIDFYNFKFGRKEILGGLEAFNRLFEGYRIISEKDFPGTLLIDEAPIQDVECPQIDKIRLSDWNICYIGRGKKPYVPNIILDIAQFASRHPKKSIQFLILSDIESHRDLLNSVKRENVNLIITELGMMHPIPRKLFKKVDVVIAGSGSARHSCEEGALVIMADPETCMSDGLLGYETMSTCFGGEDVVESSFCDALERALVSKVHNNLTNRYPRPLGVEGTVKQNFELFEQSEREKKYYNEIKLIEGKINPQRILSIYIKRLLK